MEFFLEDPEGSVKLIFWYIGEDDVGDDDLWRSL